MDASALVTVVVLGAACVAALVALRAVGRRGTAAGGMRVVARLPLEPRRSLVLVEAGGRGFLLGVGDGGMTMLAELDAAQLALAAPNKQSGLNVSATTEQNKQSGLNVLEEPLLLRAWRRVVGGRA